MSSMSTAIRDVDRTNGPTRRSRQAMRLLKSTLPCLEKDKGADKFIRPFPNRMCAKLYSRWREVVKEDILAARLEMATTTAIACRDAGKPRVPLSAYVGLWARIFYMLFICGSRADYG